jgi:hypothetical protein
LNVITTQFEDPGYRKVRNRLEALMCARPGKVLDAPPEAISMA